MNQVKCVFCGGALEDGVTTLTFQRGAARVTFDEVPCRRCVACGEEEFQAQLGIELERVAEGLFQTGLLFTELPVPVPRFHFDVVRDRDLVPA